MNIDGKKAKRIMGLLILLCTVMIGLVYMTEVTQAATKVALNRTFVMTSKGATVQLKIVGTTSPVTWSSSDRKIATVSKKGKVTAIKNGSVEITAKVNKKTYTCQIEIGSFQLEEKSINPRKRYFDQVHIDFVGESYACIPVDDIKVTIGDKTIASVDYEIIKENNTNCILWMNVHGLNDGKTTIKFTMGKITQTLNVVVETGTGRLDPPDAIKQRNYVGYTKSQAGTLKKVAEVIDKYNLNSNDLSIEDKIEIIQSYFIETRNNNMDSNMTGGIANVMFNGHGNLEYPNEAEEYALTLSLFCDALDIPNQYCIAGTFTPNDKAYISFCEFNQIQIDGEWYYINIYFNVAYKTNDYF